MVDHESITSYHLTMDQIIGTSAKTINQLVLQDDLLAYTASGGVAVCKLNLSTYSISSQRFFCANVNLNSNDTSIPSSANAYLNMALSSALSQNHENDGKKDSYGFSLSQASTILAGTYSNQHQDTQSSESPSKLKDRVRLINCIALSPNKQVLAVGEIGYQPRILLFSLAPNLSNNPIAIVHEHSFGINAISFSPDLKYVCSLGTINDGYINIWKFSPSAMSLVATNKCSSVINQLIWHESYIIAIGLRLIKVWHFPTDKVPAGNKTSVLKGKNVLLGPMINSNFISGYALSNDEFLIVTNLNQLGLLKLTYDALKIIQLESPPFKFNNLLVDYELDKVWFSSSGNTIESMFIKDLKENSIPTCNTPTSPTKLNTAFGKLDLASPKSEGQESSIIKMDNLSDQHLLLLSFSEEIIVYDKTTKSPHIKLVESLISNISGVKKTFDDNVIIFSNDGIIKQICESTNKSTYTDMILNFDLTKNDLFQNGLTAVDSFDSRNNLVLGDRFGQVIIVSLKENLRRIIYQTKAHSSSVNDLVYFEIEAFSFISSISRDRMIQIFFKNNKESESTWDILQTIPTHTGNLSKITYHDSRIYVCSSDRTISIHRIEIEDSIKVVQEKIITFKNSPVCMKIFADSLIVSTNDKNLLIYSVSLNFDFQKSLKLYSDQNESLLVEDFLVKDNVIVVSSSDKSLRAFNFDSGKQLSVAWGHLESILGLFTIKTQIYSISCDGCLFKWKSIDSDISCVIENNEVKYDIDSDNHKIPLYSKVTRKIVPTVIPNHHQTPTKRRSLLFTNNNADHEHDNHPGELRSPSPRLTNATLKRIEARKKLGEPPSTITPTIKMDADENKSSKIRTSPNRDLQSPLRSSRSGSPLRSKASINPIRSPVRPTAGQLSKSSLIDFSKSLQHKKSITNIAINKASKFVDSNDELMEKTIAYLTIIKSNFPNETLTKSNRRKLKNEVNELLLLLKEDNDSDDEILNDDLKLVDDCEIQELEHKSNSSATTSSEKRNEDILESYSDKLIEIFKQKLAKYDGTTIK